MLTRSLGRTGMISPKPIVSSSKVTAMNAIALRLGPTDVTWRLRDRRWRRTRRSIPLDDPHGLVHPEEDDQQLAVEAHHQRPQDNHDETHDLGIDRQGGAVGGRATHDRNPGKHDSNHRDPEENLDHDRRDHLPEREKVSHRGLPRRWWCVGVGLARNYARPRPNA